MEGKGQVSSFWNENNELTDIFKQNDSPVKVLAWDWGAPVPAIDFLHQMGQDT